MFSQRSRSIQAALALAVLLSLLLGGLALAPPSGSHGSLTSPRAAAHAPVTPLVTAAAGPTHGDLVVSSGQKFTIQPLGSSSTYYQGGNITVLSGGTLIVTNVTLSFVQFVTPTGTAAARLAHIYHFVDDGTVFVNHSTITTNVLGVNVYAKLSLSIAGNMTLRDSTISFPGWISVSGAGHSLTLNASRIQKNPGVAKLSEPPVLQNDTNYAADISVTNGGALDLFGSNVTNLYADNFTLGGNSIPGPAPLYATNIFVGAQNLSGLITPTDSANLTRDWLYYNGVSGGAIKFNFNNTLLSPSSAQVTVWYAGVGYPLGTATFPANTPNGVTTVPFTAALTNAINAAGMLNYLNYTGDFGVGPAQISIQFSGIVGTPANASRVSFLLYPPTSNDLVASGAGSVITSIDSAVNLTFNDTPTSPISLSHPYPWLSNKIALTNGANAYLANLTLENPIRHVFNTSAILADSTSHAYLYRWGEFSIMGRGGSLPVVLGHVKAYYAYDTNQTNNATATALNNISVTSPAMWAYLRFWDRSHGVSSYAASNSNGTAWVLLASNEITSTSLPDGLFLGGYHIFITIPAASPNTRQFNWSVNTYPIGAALGTPGYGTPDGGPQSVFNSYFAGVTVGHITMLADGSNVSSIHYGQVLDAQTTVKDTGPAPITSLDAVLYLNATHSTLLAQHPLAVNLTAIGQTVSVDLNWTVNDSETGLHGTYTNNFSVVVQWNNGVPLLGGGVATFYALDQLLPSQMKVLGFGGTPPPSTLAANTVYHSIGQVVYNGSHPVKLELIATPSSGSPIILTFNNSGPGVPNGHPAFVELDWNSSELSQGVSYTLQVAAVYNTVNKTFNYTGSFEVPSAAPSGGLELKFLGLPIWIWAAIAAAIVAVGLGLLFLSRRQAAGKLVECGECGNLIPEDARVCPKCGAEFESDVVRCSRCASTIPANSRFCPECAAQLLGKPEETAADPERQAYGEFTDRFRAEGKKELGENYTEGAFWDWWKRQPTYTPFSQWKLQQGQGAPRAGMAAPPPSGSSEYLPTPPRRPPSGGAAGGDAGLQATAAQAKPAGAPAAGGAMKPCPSCSREIPSEYLVCPFCGSVTQ